MSYYNAQTASTVWTNTTSASTSSSWFTTTGGSDGWGEIEQARPLRIAQQRRLRPSDFSPVSENLVDLPLGRGIIEIPGHRVPTLNWFKADENTIIELPDGTYLDIEDRDRWRIYEDDARVTYERCRIRAFNRFLNASELLSDFIGDLGPLGIRQSEVLRVPIEAFIDWLIIRSAEADGEPAPTPRYAHRCGLCQRFIPRRLIAMGVNFCSPEHMGRFLLTHQGESPCRP